MIVIGVTGGVGCGKSTVLDYLETHYGARILRADDAAKDLQFAGKDIAVDAIVEAAKADFKANNKGAVKTVEVYLKPEENAAYYVINGVAGKVAL